MNDLIPRSFFRMPTVSLPSLLEDIEDFFPSTSFLKGLSISEDDKNVFVEASVPGMDPKEVDVTFEKGILTIKGEKKEEEKGKTYQRKATRSFLYRVMPENIEPGVEPQAVCKNGVMIVTFAKEAKSKPKKINVKVA